MKIAVYLIENNAISNKKKIVFSKIFALMNEIPKLGSDGERAREREKKAFTFSVSCNKFITVKKNKDL